MNWQDNDPHSRVGMMFSALFRPPWTFERNNVESSVESRLRENVMGFVNRVAIALDAHGLSPLRVPVRPFPDFSYVVVATRDSVLIVLGTSPFRMVRTAIYQDLRKSPDRAGTAHELRTKYENEHGWTDCLAATLPIEALTAPNDISWPIVEKVALNMADDIIAQVTANDVDDTLCFVIMSFSGNPRLEDFYRKAIQPTVKRLGFRCERVDEQQFNSSITARIRDNIRRARFIIADITEARPNCYYELAVAHTLGKEVIHLTNDIRDAQFDIKDFNFIVYQSIDELRKKLRERIKATVGEYRRTVHAPLQTGGQTLADSTTPSAISAQVPSTGLAEMVMEMNEAMRRPSVFGDIRNKRF
jgi:hypothetical protein